MSGLRTSSRAWLSVAVLGVVGLLFGAIVVFAWMMDETHFDRQDDGFDRLTARLEGLPGVSVGEKERWVEAPTFSDPTSWIALTVDQANLPRLLEATCDIGYSDPVTWSLRVRTNSGDVVSLHADAATLSRPADTRCFDVGFDAVALVGEVDRLRPGVDLHAMLRDDGRFALAAIEDAAGSLPSVLPLVAHADDLRAAAGLDPSRSVEIETATLGLAIAPDEHDRYLALLSELVEEHGVTSFWTDGGNPIGGTGKVHVVAPDDEHVAIEAAILSSGLRIADFPVLFPPLQSE